MFIAEVRVKVKGMSPLSWGKPLDDEIQKLQNGESRTDAEHRIWPEKFHYNGDGKIIIPMTAVKNMMARVAQYLLIQVPGEGKRTYKQYFEAGIMPIEDAVLNATRDDLKEQHIFVPSDGKSGGSTRVWKSFPLLDSWDAELAFRITEKKITKVVLMEHLERAGLNIGFGRWRPDNKGLYGTFEVGKVDWKTLRDDSPIMDEAAKAKKAAKPRKAAKARVEA